MSQTLKRIDSWMISIRLPQDHVYQPLSDVLDYDDFSLTISIKDMPHLLEILEAVSLEDLERYRRNL